MQYTVVAKCDSVWQPPDVQNDLGCKHLRLQLFSSFSLGSHIGPSAVRRQHRMFQILSDSGFRSWSGGFHLTLRYLVLLLGYTCGAFTSARLVLQ